MRPFNDFAIGVDMEQISRFNNLNRKKNSKFLKKIFTKKEMDYCFSKKAAAQHLAVRFAAKEATIKAIGSLGKEILSLNKIEITKNANGIPAVKLRYYNIKISLSHCRDKAIAFAIAQRK